MITGLPAVIINSILMIVDTMFIIFALKNIDLEKFDSLDKAMIAMALLASLGWVMALGTIIFNIGLGW